MVIVSLDAHADSQLTSKRYISKEWSSNPLQPSFTTSDRFVHHIVSAAMLHHAMVTGPPRLRSVESHFHWHAIGGMHGQQGQRRASTVESACSFQRVGRAEQSWSVDTRHAVM